MSLLSYLARVREIKSEEKRVEYAQKVKAAEQGFLHPEPGTSEEDVHKAYQKYVSALNINPQEDVQQHGGMFGTLGHFLHLTAKKAAVKEAQQGLDQAKQAQSEAAPGMGLPAAGPSSTTPPTIPPPAMPLADASGRGFIPNRDTEDPGGELLPTWKSINPSALAPPDTQNLTSSGVSSAAGAVPPTLNPLPAAAGAEATTPSAVRAAGVPTLGPPPGSAPHLMRPSTALEREQQDLEMKSRAGLAGEQMGIQARQKFIDENPKFFKDAKPYQVLEFLTKGHILADMRPISQYGPPQAMTEDLLKLFPTDSDTGAPLTGASFVKPVRVNGQIIGMTRADVLGTGLGAPIQLPNGQWAVTPQNKTTGELGTPKPLAGTPASIVAAGAPTQKTTNTEHPVVVTDADGNQKIEMVPVSSASKTQKQIPGSNAAPTLNPPSGKPQATAPRSNGMRTIETGGKKATPAQHEASKAGQAYEDAVGAANDMKSFTALARSGNKVAYSYIPTEGVLTLNTSRGVKRVNMAEIHSYGGAGSAWDKVVGWLGKNLSGASIPGNILDSIDELHGQIKANAKDVRNAKYKVINSTYGSNIQPAGEAPRLSAPGNGRPSLEEIFK